MVISTHSEDPDEELGRIRLALNAVFAQTGTHEQGHEQRRLANQYLTSFQPTSVAWVVCDRLLLEENVNDPNGMAQQQQSRFFAAQTLQTKCRADWFQLPDSSKVSLKNSLIGHLQKFINESKALTLRLAMCISTLAVQAEWLTIVSELLTSSDQDPPGVKFAMLLLQTLPEECASDRLLLDDNQSRFKMRDHLISSSPAVLQFLNSHVSQTSEVLDVLHLWIRYVPVRPEALLESPLLEVSTQALRSPEFMDKASDVVVEILRMYPSHHHGNEQLVQRLVPMLSSLPLQEALQSEDEDVLQSYCRLLVEMGESYMSIILSPGKPDMARELVNAILECSRNPYLEIASMTLHFWYRFVMDLEEMEPFERRQDIIDNFTPALLDLLGVCVSSLMRYPLDSEGMTSNVVEDFKRHRFYVSETISDCCRLLGGMIVLNRLNDLWDSHAQQSWQNMESWMSCLCAIHIYVPRDDSSVLPKCFQIIAQLPGNIVALRQTCCKLIGKYAAWLASHANYAQALFPYLTQGLDHPECAREASTAIRELCEHSCASFPLASPVLTLYQGLPPGKIDIEYELDILHGSCKALSRHIQDNGETGDAAKTKLSQLVQPIGNRLAAGLSSGNPSVKQVIPEIQRLTVIVQNLIIPFDQNAATGAHPLLELVLSSWPLLQAAADKFPSEFDLAEMICRLHKHTLRACGAIAYSTNLDRLLHHLTQTFGNSHQSPYLYAASICIAEYGPDPKYSDRLLQTVTSLTHTCFSFIRDSNSMISHPDVVEEYFYMVDRMMRYCPEAIIKSEIFESILQFSVEGMKLEHDGAYKGSLRFLESLVSRGLSMRKEQGPVQILSSFEHVLVRQGQALTTNMIHAVTGDLPIPNTSRIPDILWKLNILCPSPLVEWYRSALDSSKFPPAKSKETFLGTLTSGALTLEEFSRAVQSFQRECDHRRRHRTRY